MKIVIAGGHRLPRASSHRRPAWRRTRHRSSSHAAPRPRLPAGATAVQWDLDEGGTWAQGSTNPTSSSTSPANRSPDRRWTAAQKARIEHSRVSATRGARDGDTRRARAPLVLLSGSGVGFYGPCGDEFVTEDTGAGHDFLAGVCRRWEARRSTRPRRSRASSACAPDWCSSETAARCRRCCARSVSASADAWATDASTGPGFTGATGSIWFASRRRRQRSSARSTRRRRTR